ncbi:glycine betaine/proline transport system substrate-binding protein [Rhodoligotrophos appendicifer]|uniref:glycine betaine/L-proline ABC transporter substrate-binding protein ProX n=1 Tax=Rhodoligotrophos appendicifer TaxID=987056 RepID=UPI0011849EA2|nr:glycine betaine/L-proline ABC transporter substrate-binding protein ProX [Rhodoligotrophos appendicifer]
MKAIFRNVAVGLAAATAMLVTSIGAHADTSQPGEGKTIRYARSNSLGASYIQDEVVIAALEKLGYKVKMTTLAAPAFYAAASQGDMDLITSINWPQNQVPYEKVKDKLALIGDGSIIGGGINGYLIDKKTAEANNITGVQQLKDPKLAALFDTDGDGKANLNNCDPGWSCGDVVEYQLKEYGLADTVRSVRGKYEILMAETFARSARGEPVLFYTWSPSWVVNTLQPGRDVVWLPTPFEALPTGVASPGSALVKDVVGCAGGQNPCRMTIGAWNYVSIGNRAFLAENPAVTKFLEQVRFPLSTWTEWEGEIKQSKADRHIKQVAEAWIAAHQQDFDTWVANATK